MVVAVSFISLAFGKSTVKISHLILFYSRLVKGTFHSQRRYRCDYSEREMSCDEKIVKAKVKSVLASF